MNLLGNRFQSGAVLLTLSLLAATSALRAQSSETGEIHLEVRDQSGAPMEAAGKLENLANGTDRSFRTNTQGSLTLKSVPQGRYRLSLSRSGFAEQSLLVDVVSSLPIAKTITLVIGAASNSVEVVASTPLAGVDLSSWEAPAPVQSASAGDI